MTDTPCWAIRVTCIGDAEMLPGEPVMIYHHKGKVWNATFLQIADNTLPHLFNDKEEAKLEAKVLQKQLDYLAEQMKSTQMKIIDAAFFVRVVEWDINDYFRHKNDRAELSKVANKRQRKLQLEKYQESIHPEQPKKSFRKARKDLLIDDF